MTRPRLTRRHALGLMAAAAAGCTQENGEPKRNAGNAAQDTAQSPNVIVFLADALRADHLGCYGYDEAPVSPELDAFAERNALFQRCYSQAPWTKPSISSTFTGFRPPVHQAVVTNWDMAHLEQLRVQMLRPEFDTLAECFSRAGYNTAWFLCNPHVQEQFGFGQGFGHYVYTPGPDPSQQLQAVNRWLLKEARNPFFLFIHEVNPHSPYQPFPQDFERLYGTTPERALAKLPEEDRQLVVHLNHHYQDPNLKRPPLGKLSDAGKRHVRRLYTAEIAGVDRLFGNLLDTLQKGGSLDNTIVAFTSDHGEAFGEHGLYFHGDQLFEEQIHVPLIIGAPGKVSAASVAYTVSQFSLYPTLLKLAGIAPPEGLQADALLTPDGTPAVDSHRAAAAYLDHYTADRSRWDMAMVLGSKKVISLKNRGRVAVVDLEADPGETKDLLETDAKDDAEIKDLLEQYHAILAKDEALGAQFGEPEWSETGQETIEELKAMGYGGG